jgi:hypothetical protein
VKVGDRVIVSGDDVFLDMTGVIIEIQDQLNILVAIAIGHEVQQLKFSDHELVVL